MQFQCSLMVMNGAWSGREVVLVQENLSFAIAHIQLFSSVDWQFALKSRHDGASSKRAVDLPGEVVILR